MQPFISVQKLHPDAVVPSYQSAEAAGLDVSAIESVVIAPGKRAIIGTGLALALPAGFVALVCDRSGLAAKKGLTTLAGVIDSDYRGEYKIILLNTGVEEVSIAKSDRIAQVLILPVAQATLTEVAELPTTERGAGGFGSTGA